MCSATALAFAFTCFASADAPKNGAAHREVRVAIAALNKAFSKGDAEAAGKLMTDDHIAITGYYGGAQTREQQLRSLADLKLTEYREGSLQLRSLSADVVLVIYQLSLQGSYKGKAVPPRNYTAAVWVRRGDKWLEASYQETPLTGK